MISFIVDQSIDNLPDYSIRCLVCKMWKIMINEYSPKCIQVLSYPIIRAVTLHFNSWQIID